MTKVQCISSAVCLVALAGCAFSAWQGNWEAAIWAFIAAASQPFLFIAEDTIEHEMRKWPS